MSEINIEKDDQATQEMLEMMGELSEKIDHSLQTEPNKLQADELLNELDDLPSETHDELLEQTEPNALLEDTESALNIDDIDTLMENSDLSPETSIEVSSVVPPTEQEDPIEITSSTEPDSSSEPEHTNTPEPSEEPSSQEHEVPSSIDKTIAQNDAPGAEENLILQTQKAIQTMEEAIQIDQETQELASNIHNSAQQVIQVALTTSQQAQQSTEQLQHAIEETFAASEKAIMAAKNAGYTLDELDEHTNSISPTDALERLQQIESKNKELKEINQNLKQRIIKLGS